MGTGEEQPILRNRRKTDFLSLMTANSKLVSSFIFKILKAVVSYFQLTGFVVLVCGIGFVVLGYKLTWVELVYIGLSFILLTCFATAFLVGKAELKVTIDLNPTRVVVGDRCAASILVTNMSKRRLIPHNIELRIGPRVLAFEVPALNYAESHEEIVIISTSKRGIIIVGPIKSVRSDPLGLLKREIIWVKAYEVLVHPKTISVPPVGSGIFRDLEGQETRQLSSSDVAFHTLRPYVPGDDRRFVHWKSSARYGTLMVRQFVDTRRSQVGMAISVDAIDYSSEQEFELAVSCYGSLARRIIGDSQSLSAAVGEKIIKTNTVIMMLDDLSRIDYQKDKGSLHDSVNVLSKASKEISLAFLVFGTNFDQSNLLKLSNRLGVGCTIIAICVGSSVTQVHSVGDAKLLEVESLSDLYGILRAVL